MLSQPVGLICAVPEEIAHFGDHLHITARHALAGFAFLSGTIDDRPVIVVEAGIGKVNAAVVATLLLTRFNVRSLIFSGVAGGLDPSLGIGDVIIAHTLIQHDYGALCDGAIIPYQPGVPPLPGLEGPVGYHLPATLEAAVAECLHDFSLPPLPADAAGGMSRQPSVRFGTVLTGDHFLNCSMTRERLHIRFQAQAIEMEGAALAQVAARFDVPLLVVRALSDLAGAESHMDFPLFARAAAAGAAALVQRLLPVMSEIPPNSDRPSNPIR